MSEWVDVKDELPDVDYGYFLVTDGCSVSVSFYIMDRGGAVSFFSNRNKGYSRKRHGKNSAHFSVAWEDAKRITHWMPLPEPPAR